MPDSLRYLIDNKWQIPLKVNAKGKEIRNHEDVVDTPCHQCFDGSAQIGLAQLQKCSFHGFEPPGSGQLTSDGPHRLISRLEARAVGEKDDSGQAPWM